MTDTHVEAASVMSREEMALRLMVALRSAGVELVFGVPGGGSNLDVIGAAEALGCRFVLSHTETAATIMAGVVAELSGRPSACVVTRGPGAASALNGVAQAQLDRQPLVLITDCVTTAEQARVSHQRLDHQALFAPVTKASLRYGAHDPSIPADVVALATAGRPGPVHVDVDPTAPRTTWVPGPISSDRGDRDAARAALRAARRPVVIVGVGAVAVPATRRAALVASLCRFLDGTKIPVLTTYKARGMVDDRGSNAAGIATGATIEAAVLCEADLIVGIGLDPVELIPAPWPYRAPVVLLGGWAIDDSTFFGAQLVVEVIGDLESLLDGLVGVATTTWGDDDAARHRVAALDRVRTAVPAEPSAMTPQDVVAIARAEAPPRTVATVDAGAHMLVAMPLWEVARPGELLISGGLATMGFALPAAVAAALVDAARHVVCFTGDGGIGMALAELETLARLRLNVVVVVFNDSTLSLIAVKQNEEGHGGDGAIRYAPIDFAAVAIGCGVRAERISDAASYRQALRGALRRSGPTLLDVAVDPAGYPAILDTIRGSQPVDGVR